MEQSKGKHLKGKNKRRILYLLLFLLFLLWVYRGNTHIGITRISIKNPRIPKEFEGFKIAHLSVLHNTEFGKKQKMILSMLQEEKPDIILVTGDLIDSRHTSVPIAMDFIKGAVKQAPVYYVSGNHEGRSSQYQELKKQMLEQRVKILEDEKVSITKGKDSLLLIGLQDPEFFLLDTKSEVASMFLTKLQGLRGDSKDYTLLLSHRPEHFESYVKSGVDLVFSGHARGGQFRIPFIGALVAPNQGFFPKYTSGVYTEKETSMVVSRGLGNSIIPVRINNPPELIILTLTRE